MDVNKRSGKRKSDGRLGRLIKRIIERGRQRLEVVACLYGRLPLVAGHDTPRWLLSGRVYVWGILGVFLFWDVWEVCGGGMGC